MRNRSRLISGPVAALALACALGGCGEGAPGPGQGEQAKQNIADELKAAEAGKKGVGAKGP